MKAITIHQPWATLIALGEKRFETRSWATKYWGPLAIHASKADPSKQMSALDEHVYKRIWYNIIKIPGVFCPSDLPTGAVVAIADLIECWEVFGQSDVPEIGTKLMSSSCGEKYIGVVPSSNEYQFGDFSVGRYAWQLENIKTIEPIPAKGQQRLWNWDGNGY